MLPTGFFFGGNFSSPNPRKLPVYNGSCSSFSGRWKANEHRFIFRQFQSDFFIVRRSNFSLGFAAVSRLSVLRSYIVITCFANSYYVIVGRAV